VNAGGEGFFQGTAGVVEGEMVRLRDVRFAARSADEMKQVQGCVELHRVSPHALSEPEA
jgi:hypothetical protein